MKIRRFIGIACFLFFFSGSLFSGISYAYVRGIYITQPTAENTRKMKYLIRNAKSVGINSFVIDFYRSSKRLRKNIALVKKSGIYYVARIVVFPYGATSQQVNSMKRREKVWRRIRGAIALGAREIQLDYIRYKRSQRASKENAKRIYEVIKYYRQKMRNTGVKLQIDIFGVAALKPSLHIGQDPGLFGGVVDAICPMVYPSHYEPFRYHAVRPYATVLESVEALHRQLRRHPHVKVYAFIELFNYRYPMSRTTKIKYIKAQIQAARDAGADGWYAWSAGNKYSLLFQILRHGR